MYETGKNSDLIDVYNIKQAKTGAKIIKERAVFTEQINKKAGHNHFDIANRAEELEIKYSCDIPDYSGEESDFYKSLDKIKDKEIKIQSTIIGPHRDDIEILLNGLNIRDYGSQGQQRLFQGVAGRCGVAFFAQHPVCQLVYFSGGHAFAQFPCYRPDNRIRAVASGPGPAQRTQQFLGIKFGFFAGGFCDMHCCVIDRHSSLIVIGY